MVYSNNKKDIFIKELQDGLCFAFNYAHPSGVKIISKRAAIRLNDIKNNGHEVDIRSQIDQSLNKSGLLGAKENKENIVNRLSVWLHIVNACNLSCHYCYIQNIKKVAGHDVVQRMSMQSEDVNKTVARLINYCEVEKIEY